MTLQRRRRLLFAVIAVMVMIGPTTAVAAAEFALRFGARLPVPVWDRAFAWALRQEYKAFLILCACGLAAIWPRLAVIRKPIALGMTVLVLVAIGTLSLLFTFVPALNRFYDRYQPVMANATSWAPDYSEARFASIRNGMTGEEVRDTVGTPLDRAVRNGREIWIYSQIGHYEHLDDKGFHQRLVIFVDGRVDQLQRRYVTAEHVPY